MDDDEIKAKLHAMWTPELWDRLKAEMRALLEASPQYKDRPEERNAMLESMMQRARETVDEWPKPRMTSPVALMGREEIIDDNEFKAALRAHVLHRISEERIESKVGMGGMTREQVIDSLLASYSNSDLGERLKAYHDEHGHYPEPFGFSKDIPSDAIGELKAKAWEMAEIMFEHVGEYKVIPIQQFLPDLEQQVRDFYADHGEWPAFKRDPYGGGLTMGTKQSIDQLPPPNPPPPPRPPISEEARRIGREDQELRAALRRAFCRRDPELQDMFAKREGITSEEMTQREIDACVDGGWGETFHLYRARRGGYPDHTEINDAANLSHEEWLERCKGSVIHTAIDSALRAITYWRDLPLTHAAKAPGLPEPDTLIPANATGAVEHARRVSEGAAMFLSSAFDDLRNAINEIERIKRLDPSGAFRDDRPSKAPEHLDSAFKKLLRVREMVSQA